MIPFERFAAMEVEARERLGPLRTFRILRVTHYPRSDDVAVDFAAIYGDGTRGAFECGYSVWRLTDGPLRLGQIERNTLPAAALEGDQAAANIEALGCNALPVDIVPGG